MNISKVEFTSNGAAVVTAENNRTFFSTPALVAVSILRQWAPSESAAVSTMKWNDFLASHGIAVGQRGSLTIQLAVIPRKERTVKWVEDGERTLTASFPDLLAGAAFSEGRFRRGVLFCFKAEARNHASVTASIPLLTPFPFGNVYGDTGLICWGTVRHNDIHTVTEMEDLFFNSGFNRDLWHGGAYGISHGSLVAAVPAHQGTLPQVNNFTQTLPSAVQVLLRS